MWNIKTTSIICLYYSLNMITQNTMHLSLCSLRKDFIRLVIYHKCKLTLWRRRVFKLGDKSKKVASYFIGNKCVRYI